MRLSVGNNLVGLSLLVTSALFLQPCRAIFEDDAGQLDFLIATTGHGPVKFVATVGNTAVVTSDFTDDATKTSCYVASRKVADGTLVWRRNVCSSAADEQQYHGVSVSGNFVATVDHVGVVQAWDATNGALLWDVYLPTKSNHRPSIWAFAKAGTHYIAVTSGSDTSVFDAATGTATTSPSAREAHTFKGSSGTQQPTEVYCDALDLTVGADGATALSAWNRKKDKLPFENQIAFPPEEELSFFNLLSCSTTAMEVLRTSGRGTTTMISLTKTDSLNVSGEVMWTAEEGLSRVDSAIMLDASHSAVDLEQDKKENLLQLVPRLKSQVMAMTEGLVNTGSPVRRDDVFGFLKIALLLSSSSNRLYGIPTSGDTRGKTRFQVNLPAGAEWHRLVHGASNSIKSGHGIKGGTHTREVLLLSSLSSAREKQIQWTCLDGTTGTEHSKGSVTLKTAVSQVIPLAGSGGCRQAAVLILEDRSAIVIPEDKVTKEAVLEQVAMSKNGFFGHSMRKESAELEAFAVKVDRNGDLSTMVVGAIAFPGEEILSVAYPSREEAIQSPSNALGDFSLLLKYVNPHLIAVVTKTKEDGKEDEFSALSGTRKTATSKRKPSGASDTAEVEPTVSTNDKPNFFVNIVDSVSGRILYRASHTNVASSPSPAIVISENWVFYSFTNEKTRRGEIGVLSLYEGMVDSKSLTAFSAPELSSTFSSLDAMESKPVVLAKTFSLAKSATALGMTSTRGGISTRRLILATIDGQIFALDRKVLDTRRPMGQVKDTEKKEGLQQYSELIPLVSYTSLSYSQLVESVASIVSSQTDLESQTLVLAFGGPDIFFTRTSPSRGFDLLPESFNRPLLSIVVAGLLIVLFVVKVSCVGVAGGSIATMRCCV